MRPRNPFRRALTAAALLLAVLLLAAHSVQADDNTGTGGTIIYTDSNGLNPVASPPYANGYVVHKFTSSGTLQIPFGVSADVLAVAGGGGGGGYTAGGGGAGGYVYSSGAPLVAGSYPVTVGSGGAAGTANNIPGTDGANSVFGTITAVGGGGGAAFFGTLNGRNGGSGGGGTRLAAGGAGTAGQGSAGGTGGPEDDPYPSAGGGGAGAAGSNGAGRIGGNGGAGLSSAISGATESYAGGGGGGVYNGADSSIGSGGTGGGGQGGLGGVAATGGQANTGGGGGGAGAGVGSGGSGGSGIVIVRYPYGASGISISLTSPANNQSFSSSASVSATALFFNATPPCTVRFYLDGNLVSTTTNAPSTVTVDLGVLPLGSHNLYATATDSTPTTVSSETKTFTVHTPAIASLSPADNATGVWTGTNLVVTFNGLVAIGTGNITLRNLTDNTQSIIAVTDGSQVSVAGAVLTINPTADLINGKSYAVWIDTNAIQDALGNPLAGIADDTTWNFTTDGTPPTVATLSPADNATGVGTGTNLVVTFNELIAIGTGNITIRNLTGNTQSTIAVTDGSQVSVAGAVLTINPTANLINGNSYAVWIDATAIQDASANFFAGIADDTTWNFTTDPAAPITWDPPVTIAGDTDVSTAGSPVFAYDLNSSAQTVNGVSFTAPGAGVTMSNFYSVYNGFGADLVTSPTFTAAYKNILTGGLYTDTIRPATVRLNNLVAGHLYQVQIWVDDSRSLGSLRTETVSGGGNTVTLNFPGNSLGAPGQFTIGTFTADAATRLITLNGNASTQINAIQLRDMTPMDTLGYWNGINGSAWDSATTSNWCLNPATDPLSNGTFADALALTTNQAYFGDVYFYDSISQAVTQDSVTVAAGGVSAASVYFVSSSVNYTLSS
ncbi:MAG: Ig-like domain-containing protein, partial [Verrucomicrobia bacterium]|nr:Ig-like domain-containing protein [Verrucomicrobiota bacterium]